MAGSPSKRTTPKAGDERPAPVLSPAEKRAQAKAAAAKAGNDAKRAARSGDPRKATAAKAELSHSRYTPPIPKSVKESPRWVPILMFTLLGLGTLLIFLNYITFPFGDPANSRLLIGLGMILAGILVATTYK